MFIGLVLGGVRFANVSMLYLVAVLASALAFGRGPAILASVASFVAFDWFFVQPLHQFAVADPQEYVSLLLFLLVAGVTGQLAAEQRERARQALGREREAILLADLARLTAEPDLSSALRAATARVQQELGLAAVGLLLRDREPVTVPPSPDVERLFRSASGSSTRALSAGALATVSSRGGPGRWVRVVSPVPREEGVRRGLH
ncbi:MAG: DUF4118 domain-containing protein, partial [Chloroflexota bacterium]|nr:DUF4118 domain-containing protein [Chloroflexota bacterium]